MRPEQSAEISGRRPVNSRTRCDPEPAEIGAVDGLHPSEVDGGFNRERSRV